MIKYKQNFVIELQKGFFFHRKRFFNFCLSFFFAGNCFNRTIKFIRHQNLFVLKEEKYFDEKIKKNTTVK
jgi:hypothetical protein